MAGHFGRRGPARGGDDDWHPPAGDWLSRGFGDDLDISALVEAAELGLDSRVSGAVLSGLRREPPPRYSDAPRDSPAAVPPRNGPGRPGLRARGGARSRSGSRGAPRELPPLGGGPRPPRPTAGASPSGCSVGSPTEQQAPRQRDGDESLVASMAGRLAQVELLNQSLSAKLVKQSEEMRAMSTELEDLRHCAAGDGGGGEEGLSLAAACALRLDRDRLKAQVDGMSKLLADYGLVWAAPTADATEDECSVLTTQSASCDRASANQAAPAQPADSVALNIKVVESRIEALNAQLESDDPQVVNERAGGFSCARIASCSAECLPLTFFQDGIKVGDWSWMDYASPTTQTLLKEVLGGCFPSLLHKDHPNGVKLKVVDRTGNAFRSWLRDHARTDPELADGGDRLRPDAGHAYCDPASQKSSGERLLAKLPDRVMRDGRLCNVRGAIAEKLGAGSAGPTPAQAAVAAAAAPASKELSLLAPGRDPSGPSTRLQVRLESGQRVVLVMEPQATIGDLWRALNCWRAEHSLPPADKRQAALRSAHPARAYADHAETLEAAGLVPSAALFVSTGTCEVPGT